MTTDRTRRLALVAGAVACVGSLAAWMAPNTVPVRQASLLSQLSSRAEAERPSVSPVPDSAIPDNVANQPPPIGAPTFTSPARPIAQPDTSGIVLTMAPSPDPAAPIDMAAERDAAVLPSSPPVIVAPPAPIVRSAGHQDYAGERAEWQAKMAAYARQATASDGE